MRSAEVMLQSSWWGPAGMPGRPCAQLVWRTAYAPCSAALPVPQQLLCCRGECFCRLDTLTIVVYRLVWAT